MECWVYLNADSIQQAIASTTGSTAQTGFMFQLSATNILGFYFFRGSSGNSYNATTNAVAITKGSWNHIAVTFNGATKNISLFVNGVAVAVTSSGTATFSANTATYQPNIGSFNTATVGRGGYLDGYISNLRIVNSILYDSKNFVVTPPMLPRS